jgi:hypothetical protein
MFAKPLPQRDYLLSRLVYNPGTGALLWVKQGNPSAGSTDAQGYRIVWLCGGSWKVHRLVWLMYYGSEPAGEIDHIDGDRANNCVSNLRCVDRYINTQNTRTPRRDSLLRLAGVTKKPGGYQARIRHAGESMYLGLFPTPERAHQAYLSAKRKLHPGCTI